jgi:hypothetical protein
VPRPQNPRFWAPRTSKSEILRFWTAISGFWRHFPDLDLDFRDFALLDPIFHFFHPILHFLTRPSPTRCARGDGGGLSSQTVVCAMMQPTFGGRRAAFLTRSSRKSVNTLSGALRGSLSANENIMLSFCIYRYWHANNFKQQQFS